MNFDPTIFCLPTGCNSCGLYALWSKWFSVECFSSTNSAAAEGKLKSDF